VTLTELASSNLDFLKPDIKILFFLMHLAFFQKSKKSRQNKKKKKDFENLYFSRFLSGGKA